MSPRKFKLPGHVRFYIRWMNRFSKLLLAPILPFLGLLYVLHYVRRFLNWLERRDIIPMLCQPLVWPYMGYQEHLEAVYEKAKQKALAKAEQEAKDVGTDLAD